MAEDPGGSGFTPVGIQASGGGRRRTRLSSAPRHSFSYRTVVRPTYKVMYKTVTAREWRCCPGHSGASCEEGRTVWGAGLLWGVREGAGTAATLADTVKQGAQHTDPRCAAAGEVRLSLCLLPHGH